MTYGSKTLAHDAALKLAGLALLRLFCGEESNKKRAKAGEVKAYTGRGRQLVALIVEVA